MKIKVYLAGLAVLAMLLNGCTSSGDKGDEDKKETHEKQEDTASARNGTAKEGQGRVEEVTVRALGNTMAEMRYDLDTITVSANSLVKVTLINESTDEAMLHNIVFTDNGKYKLAALAGQKVGPQGDYVPKSPIIIAHSPMAKPGQTLRFEFQAPAPGTYDFVCTFPGHYSQMNGKFIVK